LGHQRFRDAARKMCVSPRFFAEGSEETECRGAEADGELRRHRLRLNERKATAQKDLDRRSFTALRFYAFSP